MKGITLIVVVMGLGIASLSGQSLRSLGDQRGIRIGTAVDPGDFPESAYSTTLAREFSQVEPENAMKFGPIHPGVNTYNFSPPDSLVAFAKTNNMAVRGHTLVWYNQNPGWLTSGNYNPSQLSDILKSHINTVVGRYAGQIYAWDVVNEAFNDDGTMRSTIWFNTPGIGLTGTDYIAQAFNWAHAADPQALLFYNDYNGETVNAKSNAIYAMAVDFKSKGIPINGIGLQMHLTTNTGSLTSMESNIKRITDLGLQVHITEFDVRLPVDSSGNASAGSLATQAQIYHDIVALCLKFPLCTLVQTWGFTDKYSWIPGTFPGTGAGLPFDVNYQSKPAYNSMQAALQTSPPVIPSNGLVDAASYAGGAVSPGELVTLFGATYGPASFQFAQPDSSNKFPSLFSNTRLLFDGTPAPIIYSRVGQMSAIVPFSLSGKAGTTMIYEYQGVASNPVPLVFNNTHPGVFAADASGHGPGAILHATYERVTDANPAHVGEVVLIFATGGGVTNPQSNDGGLAPQSPLPLLYASASAKIGGVDCPVLYAGGAPGLVNGLVQLNVQIAAGVAIGNQPVVIDIGGLSSQAGISISIR